MAYDDSPDHEFDQDMERILQEHFEDEAAELRAPQNTWERLESRLDEPPAPSPVTRWLSNLLPVRGGRFSPAFAGFAAAVVAVVVVSVVLVSFGNGGGDSNGGIAAAPATEEPIARSPETAAPAATAAPQAATSRGEADRGGPAGTQGASDPQESAGSSRTGSQAAPAATEAPAMAKEEESTTISAPAATAAPAPTTAPAAPEATTVPRPMPTVAPMPTSVPTALPLPASTVAPAAEAPVPTESIAAMSPPRCGTPVGPACPPTEAPGDSAERAAIPPASTAGSQGAPPDAFFRDYVRQPLVSADEDNVSTFSLDTDNTSYHLALGWARAGYEVDPDSVRAEEWINAFDHRYERPAHDNGFAIETGLYPHPLDDGKRLARIAFQAPELVSGKPLNVTLVLDASGSMADGNRVDIARQAAESIRQSLRSEDRIAVVHFTNGVIDQYTVDHTHPDDPEVRTSIAGLQPYGSTNVQAGLNLGVELADEIRRERTEANNYVILMSDGVANVDATDPFAILETAYDAVTRNPLRLITIGVGISNYNDPLLEQLAQHGNGWYRYLNNTEQARATFSRENWQALSTPFADQTRAQVTWNTEVVRRWRIIGYENRVTPDHTFTQDRKKFAELYSGAATTVFYELELQETSALVPPGGLGRVEVRWVEPDSGESRTQSAPVERSRYIGFAGTEGTLAHFGAIVALAADRYGALPGATDAIYSSVHNELSDLVIQLRMLRSELVGLESYRDFSFLLEHLADDVAERSPAPDRSGYSR